MLQVADATVPVQESTPSVTVTLPVGVPAPGEFTVTVKVTATDAPTRDGSGTSCVIVVVVSAGLTVCEFVADVLALKLESPPYAPVIEYEPVLGKAIVQEPAPAVNVALQLFVPPSETVTLPVIVVGATAAPGESAATVTLKVTVWPVTEGSGVSEVMVAVVSALLTVCGVGGAELLMLKLLSPLKVATSDLLPAVIEVMVQDPVNVAPILPVHVFVPSLTVTLPVGPVGVVPVSDATLKLTVYC